MNKEKVQKTGKIIFDLIDTKFGADARFERKANLMPKTVNNWRRGLSSSYMKILPELSEIFGIPVTDLLSSYDGGSETLERDEQEIIELYRSTYKLSEKQRNTLVEIIKSTVKLYLESYKDDSKG